MRSLGGFEVTARPLAIGFVAFLVAFLRRTKSTPPVGKSKKLLVGASPLIQGAGSYRGASRYGSSFLEVGFPTWPLGEGRVVMVQASHKVSWRGGTKRLFTNLAE